MPNKLVDQVEVATATYGIIRLVIVPLFIRFIGAITFYTASKMGEEAAMNYINHHFRRKV